MLRVEATIESWPLSQPFVLSRGAKTEAEVVVVRIEDGNFTGRGEAVPYARYGETAEAALAAIENASPLVDRTALHARLPPGAARNALDCALFDLEAKRTGATAAAIAGVPEPLSPVRTAFTLSLDTPTAMAAAARAVPSLSLLKLKLGGHGDPERMEAVRAARPDVRLIVDANEAWTPIVLRPFLVLAQQAGVELVEQPLPAGGDEALAGFEHPVPVCADESVHTCRDLAGLAGRYEAVNIKLDKAGGLTEALAMVPAARALGLRVMAGSMVATSLAVAPAVLLAQSADWADLDGPLHLARDRPHGLAIDAAGIVAPPTRLLWG